MLRHSLLHALCDGISEAGGWGGAGHEHGQTVVVVGKRSIVMGDIDR